VTALYVFYQQYPSLLDPTIHHDGVFPLFIVHQLPAGVSGIVIAGVFAASMSSLDSGLNSMSAVVVTDYYRRFSWNVGGDELRLARWLTVLFGAVGTGTALLLAGFGVSSLLDAFREILGLFGGSLAGLFALGVLTRRANGAGALTGAVGSAIILWFVKGQTDIHFFLYAAVGTMSCFVIGYLASLLIGRKPERVSRRERQQ
jgi:Na+/proline symporter